MLIVSQCGNFPVSQVTVIPFLRKIIQTTPWQPAGSIAVHKDVRCKVMYSRPARHPSLISFMLQYNYSCTYLLSCRGSIMFWHALQLYRNFKTQCRRVTSNFRNVFYFSASFVIWQCQTNGISQFCLGPFFWTTTEQYHIRVINLS